MWNVCDAQPGCLAVIPRHFPPNVRAQPNHKLAEEAARRRALPCKRQPLRPIYSNTNACDETLTEHALAVRAAHRRPSRSQLERPWVITGQAGLAQ